MPKLSCPCCGHPFIFYPSPLERKPRSIDDIRKAADAATAKVFRHGHARHSIMNGTRSSREYSTWQGMIQRCTNPNNKRWSDYGGRGITVCQSWRESFINFYADMGPRPSGMTIDRIDKNGNYEPGNCRWATPKQQSNNLRNNRILVFQGITATLPEWAERVGINRSTLAKRIFRDRWSIERALTTPPIRSTR